MKLRFDKSFCPVFSKTGGVLGQRPKVLHKFIFGNKNIKIRTNYFILLHYVV